VKFLVRLKTKHHDQVRLVRSFAEGAKMARKHVGDHDPVDGCSAPAVERGTRLGGIEALTVRRSTSFGERFASVQPVYSEQAVELL
jgi:hypothetical protein